MLATEGDGYRPSGCGGEPSEGAIRREGPGAVRLIAQSVGRLWQQRSTLSALENNNHGAAALGTNRRPTSSFHAPVARDRDPMRPRQPCCPAVSVISFGGQSHFLGRKRVIG